MSNDRDNSLDMATRPRKWIAAAAAVADVALVFLVLFYHGAWPAPDTNEPHYLCKAKHFWQPSWAGNDLFLKSADSHVVFFATFGWLPAVFSLPTAAWCGRIATWLLTAYGWRRLSTSIAPCFGLAALSAAAAIGLNERLEMSGEWFVGGFEAKGIAYALVFFGLADVISGRWNRGLIVLGAASAFHVLVGGWTIVGVAGIWLLDRTDRPTLRNIAPGLLIGGAISLAGVVPGLLLGRGVDPAVEAQANQMYVFDRLAHHLWAGKFFGRFGLRHFGLWLLLGLVCCVSQPSLARRRLQYLAMATAAIVGVGLAVSYASPTPTNWAAKVLKFYFFRLGDVVPAVALALELAAIAQSASRNWAWRIAAGLLLVTFGAAHLAIVRYERATNSRVELAAFDRKQKFSWSAATPMAFPLPRGEYGVRVEDWEAWKNICEKIRRHAPADALFIAPRPYHTFKWHAERAELCSWKDIPQDARSLREWTARLDELYYVSPEEAAVREFPEGYLDFVNYVLPDRLRSVCAKYGVTHIVTYRAPVLVDPESGRPLTVLMTDDRSEPGLEIFVVFEVPAQWRRMQTSANVVAQSGAMP